MVVVRCGRASRNIDLDGTLVDQEPAAREWAQSFTETRQLSRLNDEICHRTTTERARASEANHLQRSLVTRRDCDRRNRRREQSSALRRIPTTRISARLGFGGSPLGVSRT